MKHLYLLRHAKSSWANPALDDQDRPLNKRGKRQLSIMAPILLSEGALNTKIYASTAERAQQTINGIISESKVVQFPENEKSLYTFNRKTLLKWLYKLPDEQNEVLIVGHNPALEELITFLLKTPFDSLPTCGYVHLEIDTPSWSALSPLQAKICNFVTPSSTSYREFLRKTEKEEFKAKYQLHAEQAPLQEELLRLFVTSLGLLPGCVVGADLEFMKAYHTNLGTAKALGNILKDIYENEELDDHLSMLEKHTNISNELRTLDILLSYLNGLQENSEERFGTGLPLLQENFLGLREQKLEVFKHAIESTQFHQERKKLKKYLSSSRFSDLCSKAHEDTLHKNREAIDNRLRQLMSELQPENDDNSFHKIRKLAEKDGYLSEYSGHSNKEDLLYSKVNLNDFATLQDICDQYQLLENYLTLNKNSENSITTKAANLILETLKTHKAKQKQAICH